jgi:hypothetical protein
MICTLLVTIASLPTQVGTTAELSLVSQWAAVVNKYDSGLVSGATSCTPHLVKY